MQLLNLNQMWMTQVNIKIFNIIKKKKKKKKKLLINLY